MSIYNNLDANTYPRSSYRDHFVEPPSLTTRLSNSLRSFTAGNIYTTSAPSTKRTPKWSWKWALALPNVIVAIWLFVLLWGERWVFTSAIEACKWENWEHWPKDATPHHLIFLADPQLIDPHTYPDREQLLNLATMWHSDNYMLRSYTRLQKYLHPDTIFFLGDLFDGGREWGTDHGNNEDPAWAKGMRPNKEKPYVQEWKNFGDSFWLKEYNRFGKIFCQHWNIAGEAPGPGQRGRKIIASLPGNHDLGFGANIKIPVRNRFQAYFGEPNRVDVVANHTFVSIDAVSLSAHGDMNGDYESSQKLVRPVEEFLAGVTETKRRAVERELRWQTGQLENPKLFYHEVDDIANTDYVKDPNKKPIEGGPEFPTILLTHVPLYRPPGTPCGPLRERHPPTKPESGQPPLTSDDANALSISAGYQYQNVLSETDSFSLIKKIGNVHAVFSGDDHDYCELVHSPEKNNAREITVKSMSWTMGVRKPGFMLISMWNPVDGHGNSLSPAAQGETMQRHLCLLPDQIGILINYGILVGFCILALLIRAILVLTRGLERFAPKYPNNSAPEGPLLPTVAKQEKLENLRNGQDHSANSSTSSTNSGQGGGLAVRSSAARTRSVSPAGGYGLPAAQSLGGNGVEDGSGLLIDRAGYFGPPREGGAVEEKRVAEKSREMKSRRDKWGSWGWGKRNQEVSLGERSESILGVVLRETLWGVWRVVWVVVGFYLYLARYG